jgi:hypothetical protein
MVPCDLLPSGIGGRTSTATPSLVKNLQYLRRLYARHAKCQFGRALLIGGTVQNQVRSRIFLFTT